MPFVLLIVGALIIASTLKGTTQQLGQQVVADLKGSAGNVGFVYWVSALVIIGSIGYYQPAQKFSRAFMLLIIIGMVLATKGGVFSKLMQALQNPVETAPVTSATSATTSTPQQQSSLATGAQTLASAETALDTFAFFA